MQRKIQRWKVFQRREPEAAARIRGLILEACELLYGKTPHEKAEVFMSEQCSELRELLVKFRIQLGIRDDAYDYVAWLQKLCYCTVMRAENKI